MHNYSVKFLPSRAGSLKTPLDIFLFDQVLDLVKFRSDKLEIFLNNMSRFQRFSFMDALVFAFSFVVFCNILFDIGTVSLVNAESV